MKSIYTGNPLSLHILLTSKCNKSCPGCFYKDNTGELKPSQVIQILTDAKALGIKSVAFGGGEPALYPYLDEILYYAKTLDLTTAVTTNGSLPLLTNIYPDYLHISVDSMHMKMDKISIEEIIGAMEYYKFAGMSYCNTGINHIYHTWDELMFWMNGLKNHFGEWIIILKKPITQKILEELQPLKNNTIVSDRIMFDSCLWKLFNKGTCSQGIYSMCINSDMTMSKCSNIPGKKFDNIFEGWNWIKNQEGCLIE